MITEKVNRPAASFAYYNVNIPQEVAAEFQLAYGDELVFRRTLIDNGDLEPSIGYTIEKKTQ